MNTIPLLKHFVTLFVVTALLFIPNDLSSQNLPNMDNYYVKAWEKVTELEREYKQADALKQVVEIREYARKNGHKQEYIKAVLTSMGLRSPMEEDELKNYKEILSEIASAEGIEKAILQSILAESLNRYYQQNKYDILERTVMSFTDTAVDFTTWDAVKFEREIVSLYLASIQNKDLLRNTPSDSLEILLENAHESKWQPTLYDVLANRAIDYLAAGGSNLAEIATPFVLDSPEALEPASEFVKWDMTTGDTASILYRCMKLYKELTAWRIRQGDVLALTNLDLKRMAFVYDKSVVSNKRQVYENFLYEMMEDIGNSPAVVEVVAALVLLNYNNGESSEDQRSLAVMLCRATIEEYPETPGAQTCRSVLEEIKKPTLTLKTETVLVPGEPFRILVSYKQVPTLYARLVKDDKTYTQWNKIQEGLSGEKPANIPTASLIKSWQVSLPAGNALVEHNTELPIMPLKQGNYILITAKDPSFDPVKGPVSAQKIQVSGLAAITQVSSNGDLNFWVTQRKTGVPVNGAIVAVNKQVYDYKQRKYILQPIGKYSTDKNGLAIKPAVAEQQYENYAYEVKYGKSRLQSVNNIYQNTPYDREPSVATSAYFFTDRAIYRPGQTIYFKGILVEHKGDSNRILPGQKTKVVFRDVNWEEISTLDLITNEYGSFSGSFTAPIGVLNGAMTITNESGSQTVQVEEYKRPRFEVEILPVNKAYKLNETVTIQGVASSYAGAGIDGAEVRYSIRRVADFPWWWKWCIWWRPMPVGSEKIIGTGTTNTDAEGKFSISFVAAPDKSISPDDKPYFRYEVTADVIDITGETQTSTATVKVGYQSLDADIAVPDKLDRLVPNKFNILTQNINGGKESAVVEIKISELRQPETLLRQRLWELPDTMFLGREAFQQLFPADVYNDEGNKNNWPVKQEILKQTLDTRDVDYWELPAQFLSSSGVYRVDFVAKAANGDEVALRKFFTAYSLQDKQPAEITPLQVSTNTSTSHPGEELQLLIGSSLPQARVWLQVAHKGKLVWSGVQEISNAINSIKFPITEEYIGGLEIVYAMVYDNRVNQGQQFVDIPAKSTTLQVSWKTFRDKLYPGQKENWELTIKGPEGEKIAAEMVSTLYDASLDAFLPHYYSFGPFGQRRYSGYLNIPDKNSGFGISMSADYYNWKYISPGVRIYPGLQNFGFDLGGNYRYLFSAGHALMKSESAKMVVSDLISMDESAEPAPPEPENINSLKRTSAQQQDNQPKVRTNLNETAFFFPQLRTDDNGNVVLSFTIPEALTRWNLLAVAHTKDLQTAEFLKSVITQKELMVTPNAPRFLREGDQLRFTAKINNMSEGALNGTATLVLKDALTGKVVSPDFGITPQPVSFAAARGQSALVAWNIRVPQNIEAVSYEVSATAGVFTDGEGATMPVLTNRMLVTETMPVYVNGNQKKNFTFKTLKENKSTTLQHHRLTVELTSNPAWYAVQALPYMMEYPYECAEQLFSRFYANVLAAYIANSSSRIREVFKQWKGSGDLLSQLDKNEELKSLLLEETPWVREATSEAEARNRLAILFDLNKIAEDSRKALDQLLMAQTPNGGFSWFKGMPDNRYITQYIVAGFGHLQQLGVINTAEDKDVEKMLQDAISYLDEQMAADFREVKIHDKDYLKNDHLGYIETHYLYARSFFAGQEIPKNSREAYDYYFKQAQQYWSGKSIYQKGMLALAMNRAGQKPIAEKIIEGLRQTAVQSEEMGMYWKSLQRGGWYWYEAPVETQSLLIEAFQVISQNTNEVDRMRQWLLKQKQTQSWPTTKATAEACYALLLGGSDWLSEESPVQLWLGGQQVDPVAEGATVESGTGYFKIVRNGEAINAKQANVQLQKTTKGPAWGAVYWQYFEQLDKIGTQSTGLQLVKRVFREEKTDAGPRLVPITEETPLHPGDVLKVRLELSSDRDLEFVYMKDMRASGLEPINVLSQYQYKGGLGYYESTRDAATNFFFDWLPKGSYVFEYPLRVSLAGDFSNGLTTIQSMYAPEFSSHTQGIRLKVLEK